MMDENDDDILGNLEATVNDADNDNVVPGDVPSPPMPDLPPRGGSAMDNALSCLSPEVALRIATVAVRYGIRPGNDPFWGAIEVMDNSFECAKASGAAAAAAGASAEALQASVASIPEAIYQGAMKAGGEVGGMIKAGVTEVNAAILKTGRLVETELTKDLAHIKKVIDDASVLGADKIKSAASELTGKLDSAVDQKTREGVDVFAQAATIAGVKLAKATAASRFAWSISGVAGLLIVFTLFGAFLSYEYLHLTHQIAPAPIVQTAAGTDNCGMIANGEAICQIRHLPHG